MSSTNSTPALLEKPELEAEHANDGPRKVAILVVILFISLLASSFPTLSRKSKYFRIPSVVFLIGKHFGTGVILSTAFVHLLQDSFKVLLKPELNVPFRDWIGLIVLLSLLVIFFVEYVSMTYVDRLDDGDTEHHHGHHHHLPSFSTKSSRTIQADSHNHLPPVAEVRSLEGDESEQTPLIPAAAPLQEPESEYPSIASRSLQRRKSLPTDYGGTSQSTLSHSAHTGHSTFDRSGEEQTPFFRGHHHYECRCSHADHHSRMRRTSLSGSAMDLLGESLIITSSAARAPHHQKHDEDCPAYIAPIDGLPVDDIDSLATSGVYPQAAETLESSMMNPPDDALSRKKQVVSILVLQFGIMLHSLVIGMTLAITSGPEFTSLVTAIIFHQLFEGLSLGIRISVLPTHSGKSILRALKPTLALLFAITTPVGILIGLLAFGRATSDPQAQMRMKLTQGVMSAVSAGMLIYATCVEMLAGDFVMDSQLKKSPFKTQALAMGSLLTGVVAMAIIGIWD